MSKYKVSLAFMQLPDSESIGFASHIIECLTGNAAFPSPLVPLATLATALTTFSDADIAAAPGGIVLTAIKDAAREALDLLLRQEAFYVQGLAHSDLPMLLSSGFKATSSNRARTPLDAPQIKGIDSEMSGELVLRITKVVNARAYEVQMMTGAGGWQPGGTSPQARRFIVKGLTPGSIYTVQVRAIGGSTGYSPWSRPVSRMAM